MAWPGTPQETTLIFQIFGIPQNGSAFVVSRIISLYGPGGNIYDFTAIVTQLNSLLGNIQAATQYPNVQACLVEWAAITDWSEIQVDSDNNSRGKLVDHARRRRLVRKTLANIIGFYVPEDGFFTDAGAAVGPRRV